MILHDNRKVVYNLFVGYFCRVTVDLYCPVLGVTTVAVSWAVCGDVM